MSISLLAFIDCAMAVLVAVSVAVSVAVLVNVSVAVSVCMFHKDVYTQQQQP